VLVDANPPGALDSWGLGIDALRAANRGLVVVRISNFGQDGPYRDLAATPLTMQAASGWVTPRALDRPPVQVGARIPEYLGGLFGAVGALTALRIHAAAPVDVVEVDVSCLEAHLSTLPVPMLIFERMQSLGLTANVRAAPMLGIVRAADGWIGINCLTGQHWLDLCAMVGLPEYGEHQVAIMMGGPERDEFFTKAAPWIEAQPVADLLELSQALRIPAAPVGDGRTMPELPQYRARGFFVRNESSGVDLLQPGAPYRLARTPVRPPGPVPQLGTSAATPRPPPAPASTRAPGGPDDPSLPFADLKVLDLSTFWAGGYVTCFLGAFGADVVKVESIQRPDGFRYQGVFPSDGDDWYERGGMWQATNLDKRDVTLDLGSEAGRDLARRLAADADVVVENFSPRVVEEFGFDYASLVEVRPDVILVRMPGFGLEGPWRDYVGWALGFEQTGGMAAVTGYPDGPPLSPQGPADPIVGAHAVVALLAALEHRRRTGEGQQIEVAQIEVAACLTAEAVIEHSMNGVLRGREGNRQRGFVQGVYPARDESWVALTVRGDADWAELVDATGIPELQDRRFATQPAREAAHDEIDELLTTWASGHDADELVDHLRARGIPAARILTMDRMYDEPQLLARGFYTELDHPISGPRRFPGWPVRFSRGPSTHHRRRAPTLGEHNGEVLGGELGLSAAELAALREQGVIGDRPRTP
jgi:crotonobetainyl-CoA:carnitine CoA-transferase CaiB-like acyl-CoA transferase